MISKLKNLSKNDKKLIITFSAIAVGLIIAVVGAAFFLNFRGRGDGGYESYAENGEVSAGGTTTASMPNGLVEDDEIDDFEIAPA
ncbi:MAG: hypothetical protein FWF78_02315, partial [Defluviitaleaceae bacterium]|nr:hypothetical protein [Defluviitaleaceae bacterium]